MANNVQLNPKVLSSAQSEPPTATVTGWAVVRQALTRRPSRAQWIVALLLFGLGFGLAIQVRTTQQDALGAARTSGPRPDPRRPVSTA